MRTFIEWALNHMEPAPFPHEAGTTITAVMTTTQPNLSHSFSHDSPKVALCGWRDKRTEFTVLPNIPEHPCTQCLKIYRSRSRNYRKP